jgi:hypothetical protein
MWSPRLTEYFIGPSTRQMNSLYESTSKLPSVTKSTINFGTPFGSNNCDLGIRTPSKNGFVFLDGRPRQSKLMGLMQEI